MSFYSLIVTRRQTKGTLSSFDPIPTNVKLPNTPTTAVRKEDPILAGKALLVQTPSDEATFAVAVEVA
jgi:hypothetical protein